jgi:twitching motility protein PilU
MKTFDMALFDLCQAGLISEKEALHNADSENNLRLKFKLEGDQTQPEVSRFTMASDA